MKEKANYPKNNNKKKIEFYMAFLAEGKKSLKSINNLSIIDVLPAFMIDKVSLKCVVFGRFFDECESDVQ